MPDKEPFDASLYIPMVESELKEILIHMQAPEHKRVVDAFLQAPFHLGGEAVRAYMDEQLGSANLRALDDKH